MATTDNKPLYVSTIGDAKVRDIEWAGDDHLLITTTTTVELGIDFTVSKNELASVIVLNVPARKAFQVFGEGHSHQVANTVRGEYGTAQIDGHWYGYFGGVTFVSDKRGGSNLEHTFQDLYQVDLDTGALKLVAHGEQDIHGWLVGTNGEIVARSFYNQKSGNWSISSGARDRQVIAAGNYAYGGVGSLHFGHTQDTILFAQPNEEEGTIFREVSLNGTSISSEAINSDPIFDPVTHIWIGEKTEGMARRSTLFSTGMQSRWAGTAKAFPGYIIHLESWTSDFNRMIVHTEGGDDSGTYWIVDIAQHSADPLGGIYPAIRTANVGKVSVINWKAADGLPLQGLLTLPPGREAKALPLVVLPHGGPEAMDYPHFDWWAQAFASRGYAMFQPNFRGSAGYGNGFRNAGFGEWGRKMQTDISDGVAALAKAGVIDPKRACIVGASYGGYAALAGVTVQKGLYRCAVSVAGVADLVGMLNYEQRKTGGSNNATRYWKSFMGVSSIWGSELNPITPAALADHADAPILLIHGKDDTVVPFAQSETMESALKHAGKPVEFVVMPSEDHWLSREETRTLMLKSAVSFVEKYNPAN